MALLRATKTLPPDRGFRVYLATRNLSARSPLFYPSRFASMRTPAPWRRAWASLKSLNPPPVNIMCRRFAILCVVASVVSPVLAFANNTDAMFPVKSHNFGDVAVASKTEFQFPIHNTTGRTLHIREVRTSCGCTSPVVETHYIEPGQTGSILAKFNTATHRGQKGANLTVVVDQPFYAEVRLRVDGYIRQDLVFHPGAIDFGKQPRGRQLTQMAKIIYAGRRDWAVVDVLTSKPWISIEVKQESITGQNSVYLMTVNLAPDAPAGFFRDELVVVTNDRSRPRIPFVISGELESELTISPQSIAGGSVKPGEAIEKKLVIRGKDPFVIDSIEAKGWEVSFDPVDEAKTTHIINVRFAPNGDAVGQISSPVIVKTTGGMSATSSATLTAIVRAQ